MSEGSGALHQPNGQFGRKRGGSKVAPQGLIHPFDDELPAHDGWVGFDQLAEVGHPSFDHCHPPAVRPLAFRAASSFRAAFRAVDAMTDEYRKAECYRGIAITQIQEGLDAEAFVPTG